MHGADWVAVDAVADPELARELLRAIDADRTIETEEGCARFCRVGSGAPLRHDDSVRPMGVEQSNSSIVFADETVLKVFRRLEPGTNPELEMLRFLTAREFAYDRAAPGLLRVREPRAARDARRRPALLSRRRRRLDAGAGSDRHRSRRVPGLASARSARRPRGCTTRSPPTTTTRRSRPRSPAPRRWRCWWRRSTRRSSGCSCGCPTTSGSRRSLASRGRMSASRSPSGPSSASAGGRSAPMATTTSDRPCASARRTRAG